MHIESNLFIGLLPEIVEWKKRMYGVEYPSPLTERALPLTIANINNAPYCL
ncbi:MAG: hypothetical protein ABJB86_23205 [Bacteroidota bacterium]